LLPKTDLIAFFDPAKPESQRMLGLGRWEDVMRIAGDLFLDTQMFPARFYVSKFPTDEQLFARTAGPRNWNRATRDMLYMRWM